MNINTTPWWKRKLWKLPVWGWTAIAVLVIAGAAAGAGGNKDKDASPSSTVAPVTTSTPSSSSGSDSTVVTASAPPTSPTTPAAAGLPEEADVQWADYSPAVRTRIADLVEAKDCAALQDEFDQADKNNDITMARTGHNNAKLMTYINAGLKAAGC